MTTEQPLKITSLEQLKEICTENAISCYVESIIPALGNILRSNKIIWYNKKTNHFYIRTETPEYTQVVSEEELHLKTSLPSAIRNGLLFIE